MLVKTKMGNIICQETGREGKQNKYECELLIFKVGVTDSNKKIKKFLENKFY